MQDGDYCNVGSPHAGEGLMIEDHPRKCIEDKYPTGAAATADMVYPADSLSAISYEPVKKHSAWWVWWAACLAVLVLIGSWLFYSRHAETGYGRNMAFNTSATKANRAATDMTVRNAGNSVVSASKSIGTTVSGLYSKAASATSSAAGAMKAAVGAGASKVANIIYYFGNNESTVADNNSVLNQAAAQAGNPGQAGYIQVNPNLPLVVDENGYYYHEWNRTDTKLVDFKDELFEKLPPFFWYAEHLRHKGAIASERFNR